MPRVHIFDHDQPIDGVGVWLDTDDGISDGLCIGTGGTIAEAVADAKQELAKGMLALDMLISHFPQEDR